MTEVATLSHEARGSGLFDVHAHLTHPKLADRVEVLVHRARAAGVTSIVSNGLNPKDNEAVRALSVRYPEVKPAFGLYPVDAVLPEMLEAGIELPWRGEAAGWPECFEWLSTHVDSAFAVGEIGLDGHWVPEAFWQLQEERFVSLVRLAMQADKPIIIHTRKRERRAFELLQELGAKRVNWHCFGGKVKLARTIAEAGYWLSVPANVRRSESFTRMLQTLPREKILLETDCPYLGPERGVDNEPANVAGTAAFAAECWQTDAVAVASQLADNFEALFGVAP